MMEEVRIDSRFNGPPTTGNGGYVCGLVARYIGDQAQVVLLKPPPLDKPLNIIRTKEGAVQLQDGGAIIAAATSYELQLEIPDPPTFAESVEAESRYVGYVNHAFPTCFVCGPERQWNDGLQIFPGLVSDREVYAAHWKPSDSLGEDDGLVASEFIWAALDCPGYFAVAGSEGIVAVLGRLAANIIKRPSIGQEMVLMAWKIREEGRKRFAGTALFSHTGDLYAFGSAAWYEIDLANTKPGS